MIQKKTRKKLQSQVEKQVSHHMFWHTRDLGETIVLGPLYITDLFKNKSVEYFLLIAAFI